MGSEKMDSRITPFSNGTEFMMWLENNCSNCTKSWFPKDGEWPKESTLKSYVSCGKYCKMQYHIDLSVIDGSMPLHIAQLIGYNGTFPSQCMMYSDNKDDGFKYPKRPKGDDSPDNQFVMPFLVDEIVGEIKTAEYAF